MDGTREAIIAAIREQLGERLLHLEEKSERRVFLEVRPEDVPAATRLLFQQLGARFQIATGVDAARDFAREIFRQAGMQVDVHVVEGGKSGYLRVLPHSRTNLPRTRETWRTCEICSGK